MEPNQEAHLRRVLRKTTQSIEQKRSFAAFCQDVAALMDGTASEKGYTVNGPDGTNRLYEFVEDTVGGPHHAAGEIIYKVRRYEGLRNPEDLLKIAAWAFLMWRHHR